MRILDFIIYYTTIYFTQNSRLLSWSTALERACYATSIMMIFWAMAVRGAIDRFITHNSDDTSMIPSVIIGIGADLLLEYLYIKKERYELIVSEKKFRLEDKKGIAIVLVTFILSFISPFAIAISIGLSRH